MKNYKIVITGPFNAGKTVFVGTASDIETVTTERRISNPEVVGDMKEETTVAMDYGQRRIGEVLLHLYGTPGQARFEFMWPILAREMDAFVLLVDSTEKAALMEAKQLIRLLRKQAKVPYLVVANKQDGAAALSPAEIARLLSLPESVTVIPCVAHDDDSVTNVLEKVQQILG